jgi:hypothetical protein
MSGEFALQMPECAVECGNSLARLVVKEVGSRTPATIGELHMPGTVDLTRRDLLAAVYSVIGPAR